MVQVERSVHEEKVLDLLLADGEVPEAAQGKIQAP